MSAVGRCVPGGAGDCQFEQVLAKAGAGGAGQRSRVRVKSCGFLLGHLMGLSAQIPSSRPMRRADPPIMDPRMTMTTSSRCAFSGYDIALPYISCVVQMSTMEYQTEQQGRSSVFRYRI